MKTKDRILNESIKYFAKNGFEGTSMSNIAHIIGIKKPSIYAHYKSKNDLFMDCLKNISAKQYEYVESILYNKKLESAYDKLWGLLRHCLAMPQNFTCDFYYRFYFFPPTEIKLKVKKVYDSSIKECDEIIVQIIAKGIETSEINDSYHIEDIKNSYNCLMNGLSCQDGLTMNVENIWKIFWEGIKA